MSDQDKTTRYTAKWTPWDSAVALGNVSFDARDDDEASEKADRLAVEIGLPNTPRTIQRGGTCVQMLTTGRAEK